MQGPFYFIFVVLVSFKMAYNVTWLGDSGGFEK